MITLFRNFAKSKWAIGLLVVLALSLLITGGTQMDVFANLGGRKVVSAGDRSVDDAQFRMDFDRVRGNVEEEAGRPVTVEQMVEENIHVQFLDSQTRRLGFLEWAWRAGIRPGQQLIVDQIREIPAFFNPITGAFDQTEYETALAQQNLTPVMIEQEFRDQYTTTHVGSALTAGVRLPRIYGALLAGQALETRDGRWFTVTQAMVGAVDAPTDAQLNAFMSENAAQLRLPELRTASVVLFDNAEGAATAPIPEARIVERFEFRQAALSQPETRSFVTLTAPTQEVATRIAAALRAGQTPAAVGQANDIQPVTSADTPRTAVPDPAVAAAVFALGANQVSDPIQARVGFTVARVSAITPGSAATLDSAREAVIAELRQEDARAAVYERVEAYEAARGEGLALDAAVQRIGARIVQLPPFTQDGRIAGGQPLNAPPQILQSAYSLPQGGESEVIDAGNGQYFVLRVDQVRPAALPTLEEVRAPMVQAWTQRENSRRLTARAEELAARVRAGEDIAAVATSAGASLTTRTAVGQNPEVQAELGQGVLQGLFGQGRGQVFTGPANETSFVVGRVEAVNPADPATAAPIANQVRERMGQELVQAVFEQALTAASVKVKASNDPGQARIALGLPEEPVAATPGAPATAPASAPANG